MDLYLVLSLSVSLSVWLTLNFDFSSFYQSGFYSSAFVVVQYFLFSRLFHFSPIQQMSGFISKLVLFQMSALLGLSFYEYSIGGLYLAAIPFGFGIWYLSTLWNFESESGSEQATVLVLLFIGIALTFQGITGDKFYYSYEMVFFSIFLIWGGGLIWGGQLLKKKNMSSTSYDLGEESKEIAHKKEERMFFHDLINQTQGIHLFLNRRIEQDRVLDNNELKVLQQEIKVIQSLVQNHYGETHKDLKSLDRFVPFARVKNIIFHIVEAFFSGQSVKWNFVFLGKLSGQSPVNDYECLIHYPYFFRIFTNMVKNISEEMSKEVEFTFDYQNDGLHIISKNKILNLRDEKSNLASSLKHIILSETDPRKLNEEGGVGMESIHSLCEAVGGKFEFRVEEEYWINHAFLPRPIEGKRRNVA